MTPRPLRVAHVGAGRFSRVAHGPVLSRLARTTGQVVLEGVADLDASRPERARAFARDFGYRHAFVDYRAMIEAIAPDLIVCTVHASRNADALETLLPWGIPTFTEKPPAFTLAQADRLASLAETHDVRSYVAFNRRRMPCVAIAKQWLRAFGPVHRVEAEMIRVGRYEPLFAVATAVHALDTLRYLAGDVSAIETRRIRHATHPGIDYTVRAHGTACEMNLTIAVDGGATRERYVLFCTDDARVEVALFCGQPGPLIRAEARAYRGGNLLRERVDDGDPLVLGGLVQQHVTFLESLLTGAAVDCTLADARRSVQLAVAVQDGYCGAVVLEDDGFARRPRGLAVGGRPA